MTPALIEVLAQFTGRAVPNHGPERNGDVRELKGEPAMVVSLDRSRAGRDALARQGYTRTHQFVVLPSSNNPRWLLPLGDTMCAQRDFQIYTPYAPLARLLKAVMVRILGAGWKGWSSNRFLLASRRPLPLEVLVGNITGERRPVFALSLGTPGRFRKLTAQVMRPNGDILGFIKLSMNEAAGERIRHEAAVLERLWSFPELRPHLPKVFHAGGWENGFILFRSAGPSLPGDVEFGPAHEQFLHNLWSVQRTLSSGDALLERAAVYWKKAKPRLDGNWQQLGDEAIRQAGRELSGRQVDCGIFHGDFAPWNTRTGNGHLFVFDWESAEWDAPLGWDIFHFHVQVASLLNRRLKKSLPTPVEAVEQASYLLYLLHSACLGLEEESPGQFGVEFRRQLLIRELHANWK